jgi:hypothetical protein
MGEARLIGSHLKLAFGQLQSVKKMTSSDRNAPLLMFYATENLLKAVFTSEGIDESALRQKHGHHQLDRMLDDLPDTCTLKSKFRDVAVLVTYATTYRYPTSTGNIPRPPEENEADGYYKALIEILNICARHFEVDVNLEQPVAGSVVPLR